MFLLINKPKAITSHDVVSRVRRISGVKKVGHAGTLDPNATGLLVVGVGRSGTKMLGEISKDADKEYVAEIILGEEKDTGDVEGQTDNKSDKKPSLKEVSTALEKFKGEIIQVPPNFSAIRINGKKAYELARRGEKFSMPSRKVTIYEYRLIKYTYPLLRVKFVVSSGTYIRSLAKDIGRELGSYGYLSNLKRTRIGKYKLTDAVSLKKLEKEDWKRYIIE